MSPLVRMRTIIAGPDVAHSAGPGDLIEVDEARAKSLVESGSAEIVVSRSVRPKEAAVVAATGSAMFGPSEAAVVGSKMRRRK